MKIPGLICALSLLRAAIVPLQTDIILPKETKITRKGLYSKGIIIPEHIALMWLVKKDTLLECNGKLVKPEEDLYFYIENGVEVTVKGKVTISGEYPTTFACITGESYTFSDFFLTVLDKPASIRIDGQSGMNITDGIVECHLDEGKDVETQERQKVSLLPGTKGTIAFEKLTIVTGLEVTTTSDYLIKCLNAVSFTEAGPAPTRDESITIPSSASDNANAAAIAEVKSAEKYKLRLQKENEDKAKAEEELAKAQKKLDAEQKVPESEEQKPEDTEAKGLDDSQEIQVKSVSTEETVVVTSKPKADLVEPDDKRSFVGKSGDKPASTDEPTSDGKSSSSKKPVLTDKTSQSEQSSYLTYYILAGGFAAVILVSLIVILIIRLQRKNKSSKK